MKLSTRADGALVVRSPGAGWLWAAAAAAAAGAVLVVFSDSMRSGRASISIPEHPLVERWIPTVFCLLFAAVFLAAYERSTYVFRPGDRRVHWTRRRLWGERRGTLDVSGITSVLLVEGRRKGSPTYQLALLTGGRRFVLSGTSTGDRAAHVRAGEAIAAALSAERNVPFVDTQAPPRTPAHASDDGA